MSMQPKANHNTTPLAPPAELEPAPAMQEQAPVVQESQESESVEAPVEAPAPTLAPRSTVTATAPAARAGARVGVSPQKAPTAPVSNVVKSTVVEQAADKNDLSDLLAKIPAANQYQLLRIQQYIKDMNPLIPVDFRRGAAHQVGLYRAIQNIINEQAEYFQPLFTGVLRLIDRNSGERDVFHEYNVFRFLPDVELNADDRKAFTNIVSMLKTIANVKTREKSLRMLDHDRMLSYGLTASGRDRVLAYLGL